VSVYSFSDASRHCVSSRTVLLGTTAFVLSALFSASLSFAEDAYVSECVGCGRGQYLNDTLVALSDNTYSSGSIQTSGLAADELDTGLAAKSVSSGNVNYSAADDTNALLSLLESDAKTTTTDSQRQVYVPPSVSVSASKSVSPKSSSNTPAFKEAALNVTPEEERYLRNGSVYLTKQAPTQQVKAAPVFDDYAPYMDGVRVAPIATYKAAMNKKIVSAEVSTPSPVVNSEVAQPKEEVPVAVPADNFVLSPAPSPAFTDSLKADNNTSVVKASAESQAPQMSPLEALLLSDEGVDTNPISAGDKQTSVSAAVDIPAFSDSFKSDAVKTSEKKASGSANANLLVPMDGGLYTDSGIIKEEDTYGGAVNSSATSKITNGGYGTDYASFVPDYTNNQGRLYADSGVSNNDDFKPITTVALNSANAKAEKPEDKGIIGKLKDWFTVSDNSGTPAKRTDSAKTASQIPVTKAPAADTVDEILARYEGKNKQRNDSQTIATDPTVIAVVFGENSANASAQTVRRLSDFAENAARSKNSVLKIQVSKVNLSLQAKRFALIKSILISNGISLDRIRPSVDGDNPNTVVLRVETPIYAVGAYEKIEAMGGQ